MERSNPCLTCGACCAAFRVSFYWAEADDAPGGIVPADLTVQVGPLTRAMRGTDTPQPRCAALQGQIGVNARCTIYTRRPSVCREFAVSGQNGQPNDACDRARRRWGLRPLFTSTIRELMTDGQSQAAETASPLPEG